MGQLQSADPRIHIQYLRLLGVSLHGRGVENAGTNQSVRGMVDRRDCGLKRGLRVLSGDSDASTVDVARVIGPFACFQSSAVYVCPSWQIGRAHV